jgi:hypothetical protein
MKTVGIITVHDIFNYGSILQAYATQRVIESLGYRAELIDYQYPNAAHQTPVGLPTRIKRGLMSFGNRTLKNLLPGRQYHRYCQRYRAFQDAHYRRSPKRYPTVAALMDDPPSYDIYVAGSDQIWRPRFVKDDPCFFLDFARQGVKISYASSFGCRSIEPRFRNAYADRLRKFAALSVREQSGAEIVRDLIDREATVVLDPTLLLDGPQWESVMTPREHDKPYILCYGLDRHSRYMENLALHLARQTGWDVIRINGRFFDYFNRHIRFVLDAGPAQWLSLFRHAALVLGQSFHATAFAINFERPFIPVLRGDSDHDLRQQHILTLCGLTDRALTVGDDFTALGPEIAQVDFTNARAKLAQERKHSIAFLEQALRLSEADAEQTPRR